MSAPINTGALLDRVLLIARNQLGYGETTGNNRGRFIEVIGGDKLSVEDPAWCALFAGYCYRTAYAGLRPGEQPPAWLFRHGSVPEAGAHNLVMGMGKAGRLFTDPHQASQGDLVLFSRKGGHHVALVEWGHADLTHTIEGNVGKFPAKVKRLIHDVTNEDSFVTFASIVPATR